MQQIQATRVTTEHEVAAVATIHCNGSVVTRGDVDSCGDSSAVQDQLKNVQRIQATQSSFAASIGDGSVVTWGDAQYGGDSSAVQDLLNNVQQIQASLAAVAAMAFVAMDLSSPGVLLTPAVTVALCRIG